MRRINKSEMESISAGEKCIYHFMVAALSLHPLAMLVNWHFGNYDAVVECWNNEHKE